MWLLSSLACDSEWDRPSSEVNSLVPRPLPDFISQLWRKIVFSPQLWDKTWEWPGTAVLMITVLISITAEKLSMGLGMRGQRNCYLVNPLIPWSRKTLALSPGPTQKSGRGLVSLANFCICAESAYYATHPNNHIPYIIDSLRLSHASALRNVIIANGRMWFLYSKRRLLTQHIRESLQVTPGPFPVFGWGLGTRLGKPLWERNYLRGFLVIN